MEISKITIYPVVDNCSIKANGYVGFNDILVVSFKIIDSKKGLFVAFPNHSYEDSKGETLYVDDFYFINGDFKRKVVESIIDEYEDTCSRNYRKKRNNK